jgi:hypothetical protein
MENKMEYLKCARCNILLTFEMEIEHSKWLGEFYCSPDCATDRYFDYMESTPLEFDENNVAEVDNIKLKYDKNGKIKFIT